MRKVTSLVVAVSVALGAVAVAPAAEARPGVRHGHVGNAHAARGRGYRRGGNAAAGAAVVGIAGALIGGAIASQAAPAPGPGYYPGPGAPAAAYGGPVPVRLLRDVATGAASTEAPLFVRTWLSDFDYLYVLGPPAPNPMPERLDPKAAGHLFALYRIRREGVPSGAEAGRDGP